MTKKPEFKSDAFEAVHASASALQEAGAIDQATMREFDETCFPVAGGQLPDGTCPTTTATAVPSVVR